MNNIYLYIYLKYMIEKDERRQKNMMKKKE
jgi:hypothetical protein